MARTRAKTLTLWLVAFYSTLAVGAAAMLVFGIATDAMAWTFGGVIGLLLIAACAPLALLLVGMRERGTFTETLSQIREHSMLSDNAKRVLFRDRELQMLRGAIEEDIARGDYNAAINLCDEMANLFGYREEAESFRSRIVQARAQQYELEIQAALDQFDATLAERNWAAVHQQAARIRRLYPESHVLADLDRRIQTARDEHKHELETRFLEAAEQENPDGAMSLLKQLDRYLTQEEADRLREVAQGVIVRHRDHLGTRFRHAVNERRWTEAARLGEAIVAEFPNTQMATEVRSMLEVLRTRAGQAAFADERRGT